MTLAWLSFLGSMTILTITPQGGAGHDTIIMNTIIRVKFHDGTDFNAEAVKWNLEQCLAAKMAGTRPGRMVAGKADGLCPSHKYYTRATGQRQ